jgi:hypothetical protein
LGTINCIAGDCRLPYCVPVILSHSIATNQAIKSRLPDCPISSLFRILDHHTQLCQKHVEIENQLLPGAFKPEEPSSSTVQGLEDQLPDLTLLQSQPTTTHPHTLQPEPLLLSRIPAPVFTTSPRPPIAPRAPVAPVISQSLNTLPAPNMAGPIVSPLPVKGHATASTFPGRTKHLVAFLNHYEALAASAQLRGKAEIDAVFRYISADEREEWENVTGFETMSDWAMFRVALLAEHPDAEETAVHSRAELDALVVSHAIASTVDHNTFGRYLRRFQVVANALIGSGDLTEKD